jgi:molecular chaperone HtpG
LLAAARALLQEHVSAVTLSARLDESPAALVSPEGAPSPAMERFLREATGGEGVPVTRRILELNPRHALFDRLARAFAADPKGAEFEDLLHVLLGQSLLREGASPPDAADFARRLGRLLAGDRTQGAPAGE